MRGHAHRYAPASGPPKECSDATARQFWPWILEAALCGMGHRPLGACMRAASMGEFFKISMVLAC